MDYDAWRVKFTKGWQLQRINQAYASGIQSEISEALNEVMFYRNPMTHHFLDQLVEKPIRS